MKKSLFSLFIITFGALLCIYTLLLAFITNFHAGLLALGAVSAAVTAYGVLFDKLKKAAWLHAAAITGCLALISFSIFLTAYGGNDTVQYNEDAVIILGSGIRGGQVGANLAKRLDKAVAYHSRNPQALLVVSGGQGAQESITEALAMERYLLAKGIPAEKIRKEEKSASTRENFLFSGGLLLQEFPQGYSAAFITNRFHVYRAEKTALSAGIPARHLGAPVARYSAPATYMREILAVIKIWIFS
ncbi:MAG: YdcF family protein [Oscillospiraceae bacterium]|jgi:uncharacterized SAM-binding protein YcdF (DUF218 family)|nr:YdcF family protein [Oscillospiraceae bacterium]